MLIRRLFPYCCAVFLGAVLHLALPGVVGAAAPAKTGKAAPAQEKAAKKKAPPQVTLDFKEVELADLIQTISEMTGRNFVYDDTVKGKVTIISPRTMGLGEAYQVFLTVLSTKGFTVVPAGKVHKIIRSQEAKENSLPAEAGEEEGGGEQMVTRLVPLQNIDATTLATTVLTPLIPKSSNVVAYAPSNTLILTDSAANIDRLLRIIRELDVPTALENLQVIFLEYASAEEVAQVGTQVLNQSATRPRKGRGVGGASGKETSKLIPYPRANALIIMASSDDLDTLRSLIAALDRKQAAARSNVNVYYLENADAESLAKTLNEIITGIKAQPAGTKGKAAAAPATPPPPAAGGEVITITADKPTNALIVNASPEDYETIRAIVKQLDIKRKQVFVEALIMELSMDATQKLGTTLQGAVATGTNGGAFGLSNQTTTSNVGTIATSTGGVSNALSTAVDGIMLGGFFNMINVTGADGKSMKVPAISALISLSKSDSDVNILSAPRLLTSDNEEAQIIVGSNVPIITSRLTNAVGTASSSSSGLAQSVSVERKDVALTLRFTPQVTEGNLVRLKVYQEITDLASSSVGKVEEVGPTFTKRLLQNTVIAENGKTVVLGGLIGTSTQESIVKVPFFGDIPLLGWLFKRKTTEAKKTNLLIFITPHIIRNADDLATVTRRSREAMETFRDEDMGGKKSKKKPSSATLMKTLDQQEPVTSMAPPKVETPASEAVPLPPVALPVPRPEGADAP